MKKVTIVFIVLMCVFASFAVSASSVPMEINQEQTQETMNTQTPDVLESESGSKLIEIKEKGLNEIDDYIKAYDNNEAYGWTAFILAKIRVLSIPCCFIGIAMGAIYRYVIGIRKADVSDRGFLLIIGFVTILVICQILPLVFAIVVKGFAS